MDRRIQPLVVQKRQGFECSISRLRKRLVKGVGGGVRFWTAHRPLVEVGEITLGRALNES